MEHRRFWQQPSIRWEKNRSFGIDRSADDLNDPRENPTHCGRAGQSQRSRAETEAGVGVKIGTDGVLSLALKSDWDPCLKYSKII